MSTISLLFNYKKKHLDVFFIFIHILFLSLFLFQDRQGLVLTSFILDIYIYISILSIIFLILKAQYLNSAFSLAFLMVLTTSELLRIYIDQIVYSGWLIKEIFTEANRNQANIIISEFLSIFFITSILFGKSNEKYYKKLVKSFDTHKPTKSMDIVALFSLLIGFLSTILSAGESLADSAYAANSLHQQGTEESSAQYILGLIFLISTIFLTVHNRGLRDKKTKLVFLLCSTIVIYYNLFRGDRDGTLTFFISVVGCYYIYSKEKKVKKIAKITISGVSLIFTLLLFGEIRNVIADRGLFEAIKSAQVFQNSEKSNPLDKLDLLPMMYWHTIDASILVNQGKLYNGRSFVNIIPQSVPKPLADFLGFERPKNAAWDLGSYFLHGGGFFIIAESYWNGGQIVSILFAIFLAIFLCKIERWFFRQPKYLMAFYFGLLATFPTCVYYSIQGMARWIEVWFFFAFFTKIWVNTTRFILEKRKKSYSQTNLSSQVINISS